MEPIQEPTHKYTIPLAIIVAGGLIAGAIYFGASPQPRTSGPNTQVSGEIDIEPVTEKDHIRGSINAPIVVVEYSDTECPFCKVFHNTMKEIYSSYGGQVAWVYRHFPIPQLHEKAMKEAEATECAAELGGHAIFWSYIDKVFELTNSNDSLDPEELPRIATSLGLNLSEFNTCLSSGRYADAMKKSAEEAIRAGARGTPYSVIITSSGEKMVINGAEPLASVKAKLDALLK